MSYRPHTPIGECPYCGGTPEPKVALIGWKTRMQCACGVSGAWQPLTDSDPWFDAVRGWPFKWQPATPPPRR